MDTYVINLDRSVERKKRMVSQLEQLGLTHIMVSAVDKNDLDENYYKAVRPAPDMLKGEVACMLSHLKVYRRLIESGEKYCLILEDDCLITEPHFGKLVTALESQLTPNYLILLTYFWCRDGILRLHACSKVGNYSLCEPPQVHGVARSGAYIIHRDLAKRMLDYHGEKTKGKADNWPMYIEAGLLKGVRCLYPQPIQENPEFGSEIDYLATPFNKFAKKLASVVVTANIPFLASYIVRRRKNFASQFKNIEMVPIDSTATCNA